MRKTRKNSTFFATAIKSRIKDIVTNKNFYGSLFMFVLVGCLMYFKPLPEVANSVNVKEIASLLLSFSSMGFGVSITSLALILALPLNRSTAISMVNIQDEKPLDVHVNDSAVLTIRKVGSGETISSVPGNRHRSAYLDLVFIFVWTAMANIMVALACVVVTVVCGNDLLNNTNSLTTIVLVSMTSSLMVYAIFQMFTAIITIYQLALVFQSFAINKMEVDSKNEVSATNEVQNSRSVLDSFLRILLRRK